MSKVGNYFYTIIYLKPEQILWRIAKKVGIPCEIKNASYTKRCSKIQAFFIPELNYDQAFLLRFSVDKIMNDKISLLGEEVEFHWEEKWCISDKTDLWNFNLHYFEFLFPMLYEFEKQKDEKYLSKALSCIFAWIRQNPIQNGGYGWESYTISLRLTNWLEFYARVEIYLNEATKKKLAESICMQYSFLSRHLEKHLLGNHYFENLKTLILCAIALQDNAVIDEVLPEFYRQCEEQILEDGMNFEMSPMYHKIILEDILRVAVWMQRSGRDTTILKGYISNMLDAAYMFENGLDRIPLFNDAGNNVAKSLVSLQNCAEHYFGCKPNKRNALKSSGFYRFDQNDWTLIVDGGKAGPDYVPGHSHCDAMSFELFYRGKPVIVNCGTYAYQCNERAFFRSTSAHNTVMIDGQEQSECWGNFRLARRSNTKVLDHSSRYIVMQMKDYSGKRATRTIQLCDGHLYVTDDSPTHELTSWIHGIIPEKISVDASTELITQEYAPEFGKKRRIPVTVIHGKDRIMVDIKLKQLLI